MQTLVAAYLPDEVIHWPPNQTLTGPWMARAFIVTSVVGTYELLEAARHYWLTLDGDKARRFASCHVSTDEV